MTRPVAPQHMVTRFAPSPTGRLHVGHGWSALMAMDLARAAGGTMRLRIEDIDGTRSRPEHVAAIIEDLRWLGVAWDGEIIFQSQRTGTYAAALDRLRAMGLLYPCFCTRADIQASLTAPHGPEGPVYPGTCRRLDAAERARRIADGDAHAWRIDMAQAVAMAKARAGGGTGPLRWRAFDDDGDAMMTADPLAHGDVVLARKDAPASYHLSCTLDDAAMGVTHVLRGTDLRSVTDIHRLLQALLDLPVPEYRHHPLLLGPDGTRLAKRHGAPSLAAMRSGGADGRALADRLRAGELPVGITVAQA